jgi:exoribonuclease R
MASPRGQVDRLADLWETAEIEAELFELPPDWADGRELAWGVAIDSEHTKDRDDTVAVSVLANAEGQYLVRVSIVDIGTFVNRHTTPAIEAFARQQFETEYMGHSVVQSMIPRRLTEEVFSITDQHETPVFTISMIIEADGSLGDVDVALERMKARILSYNDAAAIKRHGSAEDREMITNYEKVATLIRRNRESRGQARPEDATANSRRPGERIVSEIMITANRGLLQFMQDNDIDRLHRNHNGEYAAYSVRPRGHRGLKLDDGYPQGTSPMRRLSDYLLNCNLSAFLRGEEPPYSIGELNSIAQQYNVRLERQRERRREHQRLVAAGAIAASGVHPRRRAA